MAYLHPVAIVPNQLIKDKQLHYTTKRVALALLLLTARKQRSVTVTFAALAKAAKCSTTTAQQAVAELIEHGYLAKQRQYRYGEKQGHLIYGASRYTWLRRDGGYTLISRAVLDYKLSPAAFANLLYLYCCAGRKGRAYPSLRRIAKQGLDMAKSTVCAALAALRVLQAIVRHHCKTVLGCYSCNSYYTTDHVCSSSGACSAGGGSPKFDKPSIINKITEAYTVRDKKYGVAEFGSLPSFGGDFSWMEPCYFDGHGVKVSVYDELELTA